MAVAQLSAINSSHVSDGCDFTAATAVLPARRGRLQRSQQACELEKVLVTYAMLIECFYSHVGWALASWTTSIHNRERERTTRLCLRMF